jgi:MoxR-like ATPase
VLPDDIDALAVPVLAHRLVTTRAAIGSNPLGVEALADITARIVASTPVPLGAAGPA